MTASLARQATGPLLAFLLSTACASAGGSPPASNGPTGGMAGGHPYTTADVVFMQNMILHHEQALEMSWLAPDRTDREEILLLARRIERSQGDEIAVMERWLDARGYERPEADHLMHHHDHHGHHAHQEHGGLMAGMLTSAQLDELAAAEGREFDRIFLELMIYHHEGALDMVDALFAAPGSAQDPELFEFASHVNSDQRIEITRMYQLLRAGDG